jgi:hypothetical protein
MNGEGKYPLKNHRASWVEERRRAEDVNWLVPGPRDVLLGRDKLAQNHSGNSHYLVVLDNRLQEYEKSKKNSCAKTQIAGEIVSAIKKGGGRFLKRGSVGWSAIDDASARDKVANAFRDKRKKSQVRKHQQNSREDTKQSALEGTNNSDKGSLLGVLEQNKDTRVNPAKRPRLSSESFNRFEASKP